MTLLKHGRALVRTLEMPVLILFLVSASSFFGAVFSRLDTPSMVTERLLGLDLSATWILTLAMAFTVLLGLPLK